MKKKLAIIGVVVLTLCAALSLVACKNPALKEVAGTYELTYITGTVNGMSISNDSYEYFRIILGEKGNATVQSKGSGFGAVSYENKGKYTYKDGKISVTTRNGSAKVTETYDYADGVITYSANQSGISFSATFTRV